MRWLIAISLISAGACSKSDPFGAGSDADPGDGNGPVDAAFADAPPPHKCAPAPQRIIVVGDSIVACTEIGGPQAAACMSKQFADYVAAHYGPGASYENFAVGGARINDLAGQLDHIPAGTGAALVIAYIGGNDLGAFTFQSDEAATAGWQTIQASMDAAYDNAFAVLANTTTFPAGATLLMNTQYNPFDDCTAPPFDISATKFGILHMFNAKVGAIAAAHGDAAISVDQHGPFLGHGHYYDTQSCPHYMANATPFMLDSVHANAAGNVELAGVEASGADRLYRDCIP